MVKEKVDGAPVDASGDPTRFAIERNFAHLHHLETERLLFTAIWGAALGGVLSFLSKQEIQMSSRESQAVLVFLACFTVFGLLLSLRLAAAIYEVQDRQQHVVKEAELTEYIAGISTLDSWTNIFKVRFLFPLVYLAALVLLFLLLASAFTR